ncbi:MAG TPA: response regulator [Tepidisphaeraceae bacterium]|nr:response regulator [Tepidisphaeraceae bacterium]
MTKRTVLVVDDDPQMQRLLNARLTAGGYRVLSAANGDQALALLRTRDPRLVLCDWEMPGMSGPDLCRAVRGDLSLPHVYLVVITAHSEKGRLVEALDAGADDFVTKPFDQAELMARLRAGERVLYLEDQRAERFRIETERNHLKDAVAAMEQVLGVVAHELRTPLAALRAMSELLLTDAEAARQSGEFDAFLSGIHQEVVRMSDTVNNLLEAARLNSGKARWNWSTFRLREVCEQAVETVRCLVDEKAVKVACHVEPADAAMAGDAEAIRRVVLNLLNNARKHTTSGHVTVTARRADDDAAGQWVELSVSDTGSGMPSQVLARLGEAFALNSGIVGENHVGGTGLGLSICKSIAAAHGGTLHVESCPNKGTTVTARLRADLPAPEQIESGPSLVPVGEGALEDRSTQAA